MFEKMCDFYFRFIPKETNRTLNSTMKVPRVSLAWIGIIIISCLVAFFGYHILKSIQGSSQSDIQGLVATGVLPMDEMQMESAHNTTVQPVRPAPIQQLIERVPVPNVTAQPEEDLRQDEPLAQTPPDVEYGEPQSIDPQEGPVHSMSEFGDNLRHPEQMIEVAPPLGTSRIVPGGLGSEKTAPGGNRPSEYAPEMAQNGGEFMSGIMAFDGTDGSGIAYSMI